MTDVVAREEVPALLVLEDGRSFRGVSFGAPGEAFGEAVFSTGMTGYQETLTDPSYRRQVVIATAPQIGNTGWNDEDDESTRIWVSGYVVRDPAIRPSSWRSWPSRSTAPTARASAAPAAWGWGCTWRAWWRRRMAGGCCCATPSRGCWRRWCCRRILTCNQINSC